MRLLSLMLAAGAPSNLHLLPTSLPSVSWLGHMGHLSLGHDMSDSPPPHLLLKPSDLLLIKFAVSFSNCLAVFPLSLFSRSLSVFLLLLFYLSFFFQSLSLSISSSFSFSISTSPGLPLSLTLSLFLYPEDMAERDLDGFQGHAPNASAASVLITVTFTTLGRDRLKPCDASLTKYQTA